jgi:hypothetical protein
MSVPAHRRPPPPRWRSTGARPWIGSLRHWLTRPDPAVPDPGTGREPALSGLLGACRRAALAAIAILAVASCLVSFGESYRGLYEWAARHGVTGVWVIIWPLQVDTFVAIGELTLVVALADRWRLRWRAGAWAVTAAGLAVSVAGNIGHVAGHSVTNRGTAAIPPLAAAGAMAVGLGVLKRVMQARTAAARAAAPSAEVPPADARLNGHANGYKAPGEARPRQPRARSGPAARRPAPAAPVTYETVAAHYASLLAAGQVPTQKSLRRDWHIGSDRASQLHARLTAAAAAPEAP